ncbi:helix-turn-helix transcriptional regulator [Streptomyces sp. ISL-98]|nr:helix-turn-helix transcriptional regulator [Streptomyces sp. ISL-98]
MTRRKVVGLRIRQARVAAHLSRVALAEVVGADHKTVRRMEYGTSAPSLGLLFQIACSRSLARFASRSPSSCGSNRAAAQPARRRAATRLTPYAETITRVGRVSHTS